jgi:hypothetical protein
LAVKKPDSVNVPPFETEDLRTNLSKYLDSLFKDPSGAMVKVGNYKWGVYAFFDYDGEPIYVGQTNENVARQSGWEHSDNQDGHFGGRGERMIVAARR